MRTPLRSSPGATNRGSPAVAAAVDPLVLAAALAAALALALLPAPAGRVARGAGSPGATLESGPAMHADRIQAAVAYLSDGRVAVFGGHGGGSFTAWNTAEVWTEGVGWTLLTMTTPHDVAAIARLADGRILLAGGSYDSGVPAYAAAEVFDPSTQTFAPVAPMNAGRSFCSAATLTSGKVMVAGAWYDPGAASYAEIFDPVADTWTPTGPLATPRAMPIVVPCDDGKAIVFSGFDPSSGGEAYSSAELYDPASNTFSTLDSGPVAALGMIPEAPEFGAPIEERRIADGRYLFAARRSSQGTHTWILFTVDPATKAFEQLPVSPALRLNAGYYGPVIDRNGLMAYLPALDYAATQGFAWDAVDLVTGEFHGFDEYVALPNLQHVMASVRIALPDGRLVFAGGLRADRVDNYLGSDSLLLVTPDAKPVLAAPAAPEDVAVAPSGGTAALVSWTHDPPLEQGFRVERRQLPDGAWTEVATPAAAARSFEDEGLVRGVSYEYRVCAFNATGASDWADAASVTMPGGRWSATALPAFGSVRVGGTRVRSVVVRNRHRTQSLAFRIAEMTGPFETGGAGGWVLVAPRGRAKVSVSFRPESAGSMRGSLTFATSDVKRPTVTMKLRGRALPARD